MLDPATDPTFFTHYVGGVWQDDRGTTTTNGALTGTTDPNAASALDA